MITSDKEFEILKNIYNNHSHVRQRDLARIVGLSLGMTNAILKRLAQKGWLKIRKLNNRNIRYAVTPAGIDAIARKSFHYFKRTIKNVVFYREAVEKLIIQVKRSGYRGVILVGKSDLDFIVEHSCMKHRMEFLSGKQEDSREGYFYLYSENREQQERKHGASLRDLIMSY
jgi:DNA-binding MarR family transcriptional regulator